MIIVEIDSDVQISVDIYVKCSSCVWKTYMQQWPRNHACKDIVALTSVARFNSMTKQMRDLIENYHNQILDTRTGVSVQTIFSRGDLQYSYNFPYWDDFASPI